MNCEKNLKYRGRNKDENWMEETNGRRKRYGMRWRMSTDEREVTTSEFGVPYPNRIMKSVEKKTRRGMRWRMSPALDRSDDFQRWVRVFVDGFNSTIGAE